MTQMQAMQDDSDSTNLLDLLDIVLDQRWVIAAVTALVLALGGAYAFIATPIYEANTLIQVEDSKGGGFGSLLGDAGSLFDIKSPATAEIEILRSRLVVGKAVANLKLDVVVTPEVPPDDRQVARTSCHRCVNPWFYGPQRLYLGHRRPSSRELSRSAGARVPALFRHRHGRRLSVESTNRRVTWPEQARLKHCPFNMAGKRVNCLSLRYRQPRRRVLPHQALTPGRYRTASKDLTISELGKQSGVIKTSLQGSDPELTATVLNEISSFYVRQNIDRKAAEAKNPSPSSTPSCPSFASSSKAQKTSSTSFATATAPLI